MNLKAVVTRSHALLFLGFLKAFLSPLYFENERFEERRACNLFLISP